MSNYQFYLDPFKVFFACNKPDGLNQLEDIFAKKPTCRVIKYPDLRAVSNTSTLLIDGHGYAGGDIITSNSNNMVITSKKLAECLFRSGLNILHQKVRFFLCNGGSPSFSSSLFNPSFAQRFAIELGKIGYQNIIVGGYIGGVYPEAKACGGDVYYRKKWRIVTKG